jgi:hypothetical protein
MRRRLKAGEPPKELRDFAAWGRACNVYVGKDLTVLKLRTLSDKRAANDARWRCYRQWLAARQRFSAEFGWPGGEMRRQQEEGRVWIPAPWDESMI